MCFTRSLSPLLRHTALKKGSMSNQSTSDDPLSDQEAQKAVVQERQEEALARTVTRRYGIYLLLLTVVVIVAVVGGVCGSGKCSSSKTIDPNRAPAIATFINNITLTGKTIAYPPANGTGSVTAAEELALQWLIEEDPLNLAASDQFRLVCVEVYLLISGS
jgi:hypothetical protein